MALEINAQKGPTKYPSSISLGFTLADVILVRARGLSKNLLDD